MEKTVDLESLKGLFSKLNVTIEEAYPNSFVLAATAFDELLPMEIIAKHFGFKVYRWMMNETPRITVANSLTT